MTLTTQSAQNLQVKAIIAVGIAGVSTFLSVEPGLDTPDSVWAQEMDAVGSGSPEDLGLRVPLIPGLWQWEGHIVYQSVGLYNENADEGPSFKGTWTFLGDVGRLEAGKVLADFAKTAPGRLPEHVQTAIEAVRADKRVFLQGTTKGSILWVEHVVACKALELDPEEVCRQGGLTEEDFFKAMGRSPLTWRSEVWTL